MSTQITTAFVKQFTDNVDILAQQMFTRLRAAVRVETINGEEAFFDQLDNVAATKKTSRHGDTPLTDTPHARRQIQTATFEHADLIDVSDRVRLLIDPASDYVRVFAAAFGRAMDDELIAAFFGTAKTGKGGGTNTAFDTTNFEIDPSTALTTAGLMQAKELLDAAENKPEEGYFFACSARQIRDLLTEDVGSASIQFAPAASADFVEKKGLMTGDISFYSGFNFIRTERLDITATQRETAAWAKRSMLLGVGIEPRARISERADKSYSTQVFYTMDIGATRMDETGVVRLICDE